MSLITYIMPSGATSLGIVAGGFGLDAQRRDAASVWTRGGRYGFGLDRYKIDPKRLPGPNLKILASPDRD